jgi:hypothetical protein
VPSRVLIRIARDIKIDSPHLSMESEVSGHARFGVLAIMDLAGRDNALYQRAHGCSGPRCVRILSVLEKPDRSPVHDHFTRECYHT